MALKQHSTGVAALYKPCCLKALYNREALLHWVVKILKVCGSRTLCSGTFCWAFLCFQDETSPVTAGGILVPWSNVLWENVFLKVWVLNDGTELSLCVGNKIQAPHLICCCLPVVSNQSDPLTLSVSAKSPAHFHHYNLEMIFLLMTIQEDQQQLFKRLGQIHLAPTTMLATFRVTMVHLLHHWCPTSESCFPQKNCHMSYDQQLRSPCWRATEH